MNNLTPKTIKEFLDERVVGQDQAKRSIATAVYHHFMRIQNPHLGLKKSNILMIGPTGVGKTLIVQAVAEILGLPYAIGDATSLTAAGYVGADVETLLQSLVLSANGSISKAEKGIVFIDEIDKLATSTSAASVTANGVGTIEVQQALLKMIEGKKCEFGEGQRRHPGEKTQLLDTENILFICSGAFTGLDTTPDSLTENLIRYGLIPEFIGRLPVTTLLSELTRAELLKILTEPKDAIVDQMKRILKVDGVDLVFSDCALEAVVDRAIEKKTGARGLRSILEKTLGDLFFDVPSERGKPRKVKVTKHTVHGAAAVVETPKETPIKAPKEKSKQASAVKVKRGRGRPPLSLEEKVKRALIKVNARLAKKAKSKNEALLN
jgi:ATP-dependent Clp protease ATP-binding subunit ClpX